MIRKSEGGFFSLQFLFFLSLISAGIVSYGLVFYAQKQKDLFRKTCYYDLAQLQKNLVRSEKQLFLLNPESTALRLRLKVLKLALIAALEEGNIPLATQIESEIQLTKSLQGNLDVLQKAIILQSRLTLHTGLPQLNSELAASTFNERKIWQYFVTAEKDYTIKINSVVAVKPDSEGGLAPNYELQDHYERLQSLEISLHHQFSRREIKQNFNFSCVVSFTKEDQLWNLKINQDRPSSKP